MKIRFQRRFLGLTAAGLLFVPALGGEALADSPVETAIRDLVSAIDAAPGWTAAFRRLSYDAPTDSAVLSGLSIATPAGEVKIDFESISVAGYAPAADGSFTAKSIKADGVTVDVGPVQTAVGDVSFDDVGIPAVPGGSFDKEKPFTSMVGIYSKIIKGRLGHGHIGSVAVIEVIEGVTTRLSYENFEFSGVQDGKTASLTAGPIRMQSSAADGPVDMTIASIEATDMDMGAMLHVYDPAEYGSDGSGDLIWRTVLGHTAYKGIEMQFPQGKAVLGEFFMDGFKARQPKHSFTTLLDKLITHPELSEQAVTEAAAREGMIDLLSAFSIGRFGVSGLKVEANGITPFELGDFHFSDLSIEGLGEMAIEGLAGSVPGMGSLKVGRFAFGGLKFASLEQWQMAIQATTGQGESTDGAPAPFDPTGLIPKLGFIEASGIDVQAPSVPHVSLDKMRINLTDYVGYLPSNVAASLTALHLPLDALDDASRTMARSLGYSDGFRISLAIDGGYGQSADTLTLRSLAIDAVDIGKLAVDGKLSGVPLSQLTDAISAMGLVATGKLDAIHLRFDNHGIVDKTLDMLAGQAGTTRAEIIAQFGVTLRDKVPGSVAFREKFAASVTTFLADPKSITLTAAPAAPVGFAAIADALGAAPQTVPDLVGADIGVNN